MLEIGRKSRLLKDKLILGGPSMVSEEWLISRSVPLVINCTKGRSYGCVESQRYKRMAKGVHTNVGSSRWL